MRLDQEEISAIASMVFDELSRRNTEKVLAVLRDCGVKVRRDGNSLKAAPRQAITPCVETILRVWKDDIMTWLYQAEVDGI
jgi:ATP phosphoribosyltransferase